MKYIGSIRAVVPSTKNSNQETITRRSLNSVVGTSVMRIVPLGIVGRWELARDRLVGDYPARFRL
jgi:hypothetical protein